MPGGVRKIGRRTLLRGAGAFVVLASPLRALVAAEPAPTMFRFESAVGTTHRVVVTLISTFENTPADSRLIQDRGGMFRHEYVAKVFERTDGGLATVHVNGQRGNGAHWDRGKVLVLFDSADPKGKWAPADVDTNGKDLAEDGTHWVRGRLGSRGEIVEVYDRWRKSPGYVVARRGLAVAEMQRIFLPLPPGPVRPGDTYATRFVMDHDPVNSGRFENYAPVELALRFEGVVGDVARFSLRGGVVPDLAGEAFARAMHPIIKWIDRIDVDGVMDVDLATGWPRAKDQTMRIAYRWIQRPSDDVNAAPQILRVVNRRRLIVRATRMA